MSSRILKGLSLAEKICAPNLKLPKHSHRLAGFGLALQGRCTESYEKAALECNPSSVKFHPAGEPHSNVYGNTPVRYFIVEIEPVWLTRMGANALIEKDPVLFSDNSISWLMMKLRKEFRSTDVEATLVIEGLVLQLIAETSRSRKALSEDNFPRWLKEAKELLDEQFSENLSLSFIAQSVGVHPVHLAHSFKRYYRCSVGEYVRRLRIEFACRQLSKTDIPLVQVALNAGFSHQAHFSRVFKRAIGTTPAVYRSNFLRS